jgi:hypothetical protein
MCDVTPTTQSLVIRRIVVPWIAVTVMHELCRLAAAFAVVTEVSGDTPSAIAHRSAPGVLAHRVRVAK